MAQAIRLPRNCRVVCGIHDSNASYLRHLLERREQQFALISSGTWTVIMAHRADLARLRPEHDMLVNVDAFGTAVATARFMGGREYEAIATTDAPPTSAAAAEAITRGAMALPCFAAGGPFSQSAGRLVHAEGLTPTECATLATLYVALMSDVLLEALGVKGEIIVDGPLAANPVFASLLAELRPDDTVWVDEERSAIKAIRYLAGYPTQHKVTLEAASAYGLNVAAYRDRWRSMAGKNCLAVLRKDAK